MSLLNVAAVFSTVYSSGPTNDAIVPAAADAISDFNSIPAFAGIHTVLGVLLLFIFLLFACIPTVVSGHAIAVILAVACCWRYCCCLRHCCCLHPNCCKHSCCCCRSFSSWWVTVAGLPAIPGVPGAAGISAVPFELSVAGGPAVVGFLLLMAFLLLLASLLVLHAWFYIFKDCRTIGLWLSDYFSAIVLSEYQISDWWIQETIRLSDIGTRPQSIGLSDIRLRKKISVAHLCTYYMSGTPLFMAES